MADYHVTIRKRDGKEVTLPAIQIERTFHSDPETHQQTGITLQLLHRRQTEERDAEATMVNIPDDGTTDVFVVAATTGKTIQSFHWPPRPKEMRNL